MKVAKSSGRIIVDTYLKDEHIEAVANDTALAVLISNYYPQKACRTLGEKILLSDQIESYTHDQVVDGTLVQNYYGVDRLGVPFNSTYNSPESDPQKQRYYSSVSESSNLLRNLSAPFGSPADRLRLDLDNQYKSGARVASFEGLPMLAGIARITHAANSHLGSDQPHFDALPLGYSKLDSQMAANIYLKTPCDGGYLEIWDVPPLEPLFEPPHNWRSKLPCPSVLYPHEGDLIIFNCRKPHAVSPFSGDPRISVQMFMGYQKGKPLMLWN